MALVSGGFGSSQWDHVMGPRDVSSSLPADWEVMIGHVIRFHSVSSRPASP